MANKKVSQLVLLICALVVFALILTGLNVVTAPIIEANNNSAEFEPLFGVMPSAKSFQKLDVAAPATVKSVWKETSGQGYVVRCATNKGYTGDYIELTVAVAADGKISGISLDAYPESRDFGTETYPQTYVGNDSTLANVQIVGGVTYSSSAFKGAVADAFSVLIDNGFIGAGVKEASQIIVEMIPVVNADMCSESGQLQAKETEASASVKKAWVSDSGKSVAYWIENSGDYLAVIDADGAVTVFDLDAKVVSNAAVQKIAEEAYQALLDAQAGQDLEEIMPLIPGAKGFKKLNVPAADTVKSVWQETSGLGYVVRSTTNKGFTHEYINLSTAFTADGKIFNIVLETYPETRDFGAEYPSTFVGQDSTLSGVSLVAGVTYSSSAFKGAVADAFAALTENGLVVEAVKEPSQVVSEMLPVKASGMANPQGIFQGTEITVDSNMVVKAWMSPTKGVSAYWINNGEADFLAVANVSGSVSVFDLKGNDVSVEAENLAAIALRDSVKVLKAATNNETKKITKLLPADVTPVEVKAEGIYSSVQKIMKAEAADGVYYGFMCRTFGFGNGSMTYYYAIDPSGKVCGMDAGALIIEPEYFNVKVDKADYVSKMTGVTSDWTGEEALVAGATLTTQATQATLNDAFAAYALLRGGKN